MPFDGTNFDRQNELFLLRDGLAILRRRGWCQGSSYDRHGRVCIYAAMREAGLKGNWPQTLPWPAVWQDEPGRTQAEAEAWFEREIALREE